MSRGDTAAAGTEFSRALEIDPDFAPSLLARAVVLHEQGDYGRAADLFERILSQRPHVVEEGGRAGSELDTLAAAYAASGDFTQAIAVASRSLARAEAAGEMLVAASIRARLESYRAGRPYRADPAAGSSR